LAVTLLDFSRKMAAADDNADAYDAAREPTPLAKTADKPLTWAYFRSGDRAKAVQAE
jgi:hypothetical protein